MLLLLTGNVYDDLALMKHDQAIAVTNGIFHVMSDHESRQLLGPNQLISQCHDRQ